MQDLRKIAVSCTLLLFTLGTVTVAFADALRELDRDLLDAVREGSTAKVRDLIQKGADVKAGDESGNTPLHYATQREVAELLISAGAPVNAKNNDFEMTPLFDVPADVAALLIAKGADVNARAKKGTTPLAWTVYWDQKDKALLLISQGADVNAKDDDGKTPLHIAANWGKKDFVNLLIAAGANVNARDMDCWTPLHWAAFEADVGTMDILLKSGADPNAASCIPDGILRPGATPLDVAQKFRSAEVVLYLKGRGCRSASP